MTVEELWRQYLYHLRVKRRSKAALRYYETTRRASGRFLDEDLKAAHLRFSPGDRL